jgi:hypothetical protein
MLQGLAKVLVSASSQEGHQGSVMTARPMRAGGELVEPASNMPCTSWLEVDRRLVADSAGVGLAPCRGPGHMSDGAEASMPSRRLGREWKRDLTGTLLASWDKVWSPVDDNKDAPDLRSDSGSAVASDSFFRRLFPDRPPVHDAKLHSATVPVMPASPLGVKVESVEAEGCCPPAPTSSSLQEFQQRILLLPSPRIESASAVVGVAS